MRAVMVTPVLMKMVEDNRLAVDVRNRTDSRDFSMLDIPGGDTRAWVLYDFYPFEALGPIVERRLPRVCEKLLPRVPKATGFPVVEDGLASVVVPESIELHTKPPCVLGLVEARRKAVRNQRNRVLT